MRLDKVVMRRGMSFSMHFVYKIRIQLDLALDVRTQDGETLVKLRLTYELQP